MSREDEIRDALLSYAERTTEAARLLGALAEDVPYLLQESERLLEARDLAKRASSAGAAPDYDEEAIRDALWGVVNSLLAGNSGNTRRVRPSEGRAG